MLKFANSYLFPCSEHYDPCCEIDRQYQMPKIVTSFEKQRKKKEVINELLNICFEEFTDCHQIKKMPS